MLSLDEKYKLFNGDSVEVLRTFPDASVDSIVTDPPYELGFMGKAWDKSGITYNVELWREALRVLKPGGHLLAFGGTRTYHRLACAIEDAGFEIRDQIQWIYGSGFPKSLNVGNGFGTALKPANEPIVLARKPLEKGLTVAQNVLKHGAGAINIDGCRIEYTGQTDPRTFGGSWKTDKAAQNVYEGGYEGSNQTVSNLGRFPANVIHDGSDEVVDLFPISKGQQGDLVNHSNTRNSPNGIFGKMNSAVDHLKRNDSGSAARFFYCAKTSKSDRNEGCESLNLKRGGSETFDAKNRAGVGEDRMPTNRNHHPTVKPTELMRYLCRLITPPNGTVLDIFLGSGSTGKAAIIEGFKFIGIEKESEYFEIAEARIKGANLALPLFQDSQ